MALFTPQGLADLSERRLRERIDRTLASIPPQGAIDRAWALRRLPGLERGRPRWPLHQAPTLILWGSKERHTLDMDGPGTGTLCRPDLACRHFPDCEVQWIYAADGEEVPHASLLKHAAAFNRPFYRPQADGYDRFRERLLRGRRELIDALPVGCDSTVVELGGGTGRNLEFFGERLATFSSVVLVDLCPPLLERARERCRLHDWTNVHCIEADATRFGPEAPVDCVYLSYALTMIPDWFAAIDNALAMLKPGGTLGVVDFYVSRAHPPAGLRSHGLATRHFWPLWFGHGGVHLNPDHLPYLLSRTIDHQVIEDRSPVPWMGGLRVPCYRFIGRKAG